MNYDDIRNVAEDPIKSKIMVYFFDKDKFNSQDVNNEVQQQKVVAEALDSLVSIKMLSREGNYYRKTKKGWNVSLALKGHEQEVPNILPDPKLDVCSSDFVLNIGCGGGAGLNALCQCSPNVIGVDINLESLFVAKVKTGATLIMSDAQSLPFKNASFDLVLCYEVLPYVGYQERLIAEASRVLKDDGTIVILFLSLGYGMKLIFGNLRKKRAIRQRLITVLVVLNTFLYQMFGWKLTLKRRYRQILPTENYVKRTLEKYQIQVTGLERVKERYMGIPVLVWMKGCKIPNVV